VPEEGAGVKIVDEDMLDNFRVSGLCEICYKPQARREAFHILARGFGGGSRLDVRINLLGSCHWCNQFYSDDTLEFQGRKLRLPDMLEIVSHRERIPLDVDLLDVLYLLQRLPKDCRPWQLKAQMVDLTSAQRVLVERTLREAQ
jgi:hypothetical protein